MDGSICLQQKRLKRINVYTGNTLEIIPLQRLYYRIWNGYKYM